MGLLPRLTISIVLVILAAGSLRGYLQVVTESAYVREHHQSELRETQHFLEQMLPNYATTGDVLMIQQLLDTQVKERDDIGSIQWQSRFGSLAAQDEGTAQLDVPDWFVRIASIPAEEKISSITMDGVSFGTLTLRVDPVPSLNRLWLHLMTQFKMIALVNVTIILLLVLLLLGGGGWGYSRMR